jgi:hypothetical protein
MSLNIGWSRLTVALSGCATVSNRQDETGRPIILRGVMIDMQSRTRL